jgi:hypothetical protein
MIEIDDALYDALYANAGLQAAVGTRIYRGRAPAGATYPLVTYGLIGGGEVTETPAEAWDGRYLVQAVSQVSAAEAETLGGHIRTAMNRVTLTVSGWTNIWTAVAPNSFVVELDERSGVQTWRAGRTVRIRLSK